MSFDHEGSVLSQGERCPAQAFFRIIWSECGPFIKRRLLSVLVLVAAGAAVAGFSPIALKLLVDEIGGDGNGNSTSPFLVITLFVVSQFVARALVEIRTLVYARAERRFSRELNQRLFDHLMNLPLGFHLDRQTGAVNQTVASGLEGFQIVLNHLILTAIPVTVELCIVIVILGHLAPPPFMSVFAGGIFIYGLAFIHASVRIAKPASLAVASTIAANGTITDGILNYEAIKYFAAEGVVHARVGRALTQAETEWVSYYRLYARNGLFLAFVFAGFLAISTLCATTMLQAGRITIGDFLVFNTYLFQVLRPVESLGYATQGVSQGWGMLKQLLGLLAQEPESEHAKRVTPVGAAAAELRGTLEFQEVSASYRAHEAVLRGLSFTIRPGKTIGIVGSSGSGKSTVVRLLVRLLEPDGGRILLDGAEIRELSLASLRQLVAVVPQDTMLFNDSIAFNIALGKPNCSTADIEHAARVAHLHDMIMSWPDRYDTRVGERGVKLSGGERQRVSIARAVIKQPLIYVFDEATSSLDTQTERRILENLLQVSRSTTTLIIAHRLSTVRHADEIVVLDAGMVVERGTHDRLVRSRGHYAALWEAQHQATMTMA